MGRGFLIEYLGEEGGCDGELPLTQKVHGDSTVDEVFLFGEDIMFRTREGPVLEELGGFKM